MIDGTNTLPVHLRRAGPSDQDAVRPSTAAAFNCTTSTFSYDYSKPDQMVETYPDGAAVTYTTDDGGNLMGVSVPAQSDGSPAFKTASTLPNTMATQGSSTAASSGTREQRDDGDAALRNAVPRRADRLHVQRAGGRSRRQYDVRLRPGLLHREHGQLGDELAAGSAAGRLRGPGRPSTATCSTRTGTCSPTARACPPRCTPHYGYNGGGVGQPVTEPSGSGTAGVRLTSYSGDYTTSGPNSIADGTYAYNADGQPTSISASNGPLSSPTTVSWTLGYGTNGEINSVSTTAPNPSNTPGSGPQYTYDAAGDLTAADVEPPYQTLTQAGVQWTFAYNDAGPARHRHAGRRRRCHQLRLQRRRHARLRDRHPRREHGRVDQADLGSADRVARAGRGRFQRGLPPALLLGQRRPRHGAEHRRRPQRDRLRLPRQPERHPDDDDRHRRQDGRRVLHRSRTATTSTGCWTTRAWEC